MDWITKQTPNRSWRPVGPFACVMPRVMVNRQIRNQSGGYNQLALETHWDMQSDKKASDKRKYVPKVQIPKHRVSGEPETAHRPEPGAPMYPQTLRRPRNPNQVPHIYPNSFIQKKTPRNFFTLMNCFTLMNFTDAPFA